ncbi:hypothetical protein G6F50_014845 [Rhizopus delemar]|uniref:Uncharacterized protein n=1 Tax=Rhizopus delemar TaxID=936053 RepID=A0A9P7C628_9FUNG|nr:hypothetical protein G6F50_014845 [Rhizopus delemar]
MAATTLPMARPAMKMLTAFTRCAFSREMLIAPLAMRNSARSDSVTIGIVQAQRDREPAIPLPQFADLAPAQCGLDHFVDVAHIQPIARGAVTVDLDLQLRQRAVAVDEGTLHAVHAAHLAENRLGLPVQHVEVRAADLDHHLPLDQRSEERRVW